LKKKKVPALNIKIKLKNIFINRNRGENNSTGPTTQSLVGPTLYPKAKPKHSPVPSLSTPPSLHYSLFFFFAQNKKIKQKRKPHSLCTQSLTDSLPRRRSKQKRCGIWFSGSSVYSSTLASSLSSFTLYLLSSSPLLPNKP